MTSINPRDPLAAQQALDDAPNLSPNQRQALQQQIDEMRASAEAEGLRLVDEQMRYVTETTARITETYGTCRSGYSEFAQWLRDNEPNAKEARARLDALRREEISMARLTEGVGRTLDDAERVKADPVGYISRLRNKYNL